jgi:hypothetical protein
LTSCLAAFGDSRAAVGVGLVLGTQLGRLEANYSWVLRQGEHGQDQLSPARFALSVSF